MTTTPSSTRLIVICGALLALAGCAREFPNQPLATFTSDQGYRIDRVPFDEQDDVALIVTFSGGGTRAAAFTLGALEALAEATYEKNGQTKSVLDEVDIISSVSGGSVTAAAYGLYGRESFKRLEDNFLYEDIMGELYLAGLNPATWFRLMSPNYSRIDALVEAFDEHLFDGADYAKLEARGLKPYVVLNAADMSSGDVFSMTQEDFDLICSDLSKFSLARATAASAAFPVLLTPVTLQNHSGTSCAAEFPDKRWKWVKNAFKGRHVNLDHFRWAKRNLALRLVSGADGEPQAERKPQFIHLLDGGLADNLGLQVPMRLLSTLRNKGSLLGKLNRGLFKRVAIIVVNARSDGDRVLDADPDTPGLVSMIGAVVSVPMDRVISDRQDGIRKKLDELSRAQGNFVGCDKQLKKSCEASMPNPLGYLGTKFFTIDIDFDLVDDVAQRRELKNIPTSWSLKRGQVDLLRKTAKELFRNSKQFQALLMDLEINN